ncbi:MAG: DUF1109 domain-containing protein, partial [Myxococcaceae bacterium]
AAGLKCALWEIGLALPALSAGLFLLTRSAHNPARALLLGAASGLVGITALHLHCPNGTWEHLLLSHLLPWGVVSGAALLLRPKLATQSFAP